MSILVKQLDQNGDNMTDLKEGKEAHTYCPACKTPDGIFAADGRWYYMKCACTPCEIDFNIEQVAAYPFLRGYFSKWKNKDQEDL